MKLRRAKVKAHQGFGLGCLACKPENPSGNKDLYRQNSRLVGIVLVIAILTSRSRRRGRRRSRIRSMSKKRRMSSSRSSSTRREWE